MTNHDYSTECPLCMETLEIDDLSFYPCSCGYQICRFCWHRIRTDENGLCPACRKAYSENPAEFKPLTDDELQSMKKERRQKGGTDKRQKLVDSRRQFAGVRVVQKNLVFVVGLSPRLSDADVLRRQEYFGKFGKIIKVVVNPNTSYAGGQGHSASAYVTYQRPEDAMRAIKTVNNMHVDGKTLKASLGTTKYCSHFLKGTQCTKPDCMYLHEPGDEAASFSKEDMQLGRHTEYELELCEQFLNSTNIVLPPPIQPTAKSSTSKKTNSPVPPTVNQSNMSPPPSSSSPREAGLSVSQKASPSPGLLPPDNSNLPARHSPDTPTARSADADSSPVHDHNHMSATASETTAASCVQQTTPQHCSNQSQVTPGKSQVNADSPPKATNQNQASARLPVQLAADNTATAQQLLPVSRLGLVAGGGDGEVNDLPAAPSLWWPNRDTSLMHGPAGVVPNGFAHRSQPPISLSASYPLQSTSTKHEENGPNKQASSADYDSIDDDLGFDPWAVSSMGLADLLEKETSVRHTLPAPVNGLHYPHPMMGAMPFAFGGVPRPSVGAPRNFPLDNLSNGVARPLPATPPGFMVNKMHLMSRDQQQQSDVRHSASGMLPPYHHTHHHQQQVGQALNNSYPSSIMRHGQQGHGYPSNGFHKSQQQQQLPQSEPADHKDWQDGLRALLPNINISFGANSANTNTLLAGHQAHLQHAPQHKGWSHSTPDLMNWNNGFHKQHHLGSTTDGHASEDAPHWMASIHSLTDDVPASRHWPQSVPPHPPPASQLTTTRSPPPGFFHQQAPAGPPPSSAAFNVNVNSRRLAEGLQ